MKTPAAPAQPSMFDALPTPPASPKRFGETYEVERDGARINRQRHAVFALMSDGGWHTLEEIAKTVGYPAPSVSARLRDFRKAEFGGHTVEREYVSKGLWRYRLLAKP